MDRLFILVLFLCAGLRAQLTLSTVRGTANDTAGAAVADAVSTITNIETNARHEVKTSDISAPGTVGVVSGLVDGASGRQIELRGRIDF